MKDIFENQVNVVQKQTSRSHRTICWDSVQYRVCVLEVQMGGV